MRRIPSIVCLGALCLVLVTACGSDGSDGGLSAKDKKVIAAGLLREGDVAGAIKGLPDNDGGSTRAIAKLIDELPECAPFADKDRDGIGDRNSNRYSQDIVETSSSADMYPTAEVAAGQLALFTDPGLPACLQGVFRTLLAPRIAKAGGILG